MQMSGQFYPPKQGLYDPTFEHDSCGVGFVANIKGKRSHQIVKDGIQILENLTHRGAADLLFVNWTLSENLERAVLIHAHKGRGPADRNLANVKHKIDPFENLRGNLAHLAGRWLPVEIGAWGSDGLAEFVDQSEGQKVIRAAKT